MEPSPIFGILSTDFNVYENKVHGGLYTLSDRLSEIVNMNAVGVHGSYQFELKDDVGLSIGGRVNYAAYSFDITQLNYADPNDPTIANLATSIRQPDFDLGAWFYSNKFQGGISIRHISPVRPSVKPESAISSGGDLYPIHAYLVAGYRFEPSEKISIEPMFRFQSVPGINLLMTSVMVGFDKTFFVGVNYRNFDRAVPTDLQMRIRAKDKLSVFGSINLNSFGRSANSYQYNAGISVAL